MLFLKATCECLLAKKPMKQILYIWPNRCRFSRRYFYHKKILKHKMYNFLLFINIYFLAFKLGIQATLFSTYSEFSFLASIESKRALWSDSLISGQIWWIRCLIVGVNLIKTVTLYDDALSAGKFSKFSYTNLAIFVESSHTNSSKQLYSILY